ncbi:Uncharacterised protein [Shigella sonnei]|nr:Uncharacterised protein [Shigella sonnei]CSF19515.1 Uncharacterised protein [Shigella sonnei]CSF89179.1 Uncharacterised protein [Shigella sonnei]
MQCKSGLCCRQQGIVTVFWFCACVSGGTGEVRVKFGGCHKIITAAHHGARRYASANVHGSKIINIIYDTCIDHRPRATRTFLCRLKNQFDDAM